MDELSERRAKREGRITVKELIHNLYDASKLTEIESIVFVCREKSGEIRTGWNDVLHSEIIGLLELGKQMVIDNMRE